VRRIKELKPDLQELKQIQDAVTALNNPVIIDSCNLMLMDQIMNLKEKYLKQVHPYKITKQKYGKERWKTYYRNEFGKLKAVERTKRADLINYLYNHYTGNSENKTVNAVFEELMQHKKTVLNRSQGTIEKNRYTFRLFGKFAEKKIRSVTQQQIGELIQNYIKEYRPIETALKAYVQLIHGIFRYALSQGYIEKDISLFIDVAAYFKDCSHQEVLPEDKILSPDEINYIKQAAKERVPNPRAYMILLAIVTGMRSGELCALHWSDVDFENKMLHIHRQQIIDIVDGKRQGFYEVDYTKDERRRPHGGRYFPITNEIKCLLKELRSISDESEHIFSENGKYIEKTSYEKYLNRLCKSIGISITKNHAFRMTLNSNVLIEQGLNTKQRAYILGHSVSTNERYYTYTRQEEIEEIRNTLESPPPTKEPPEENTCLVAKGRYRKMVNFEDYLATKDKKTTLSQTL